MSDKITVSQRPDGQYEGRRTGARRASVVAPTQAEAVDRSREVLRNSGGGELAIRAVRGTARGQIRDQDTVAPGNDPRRSKG